MHRESGETRTFEADYFFSTMPVKELIRALDAPVPDNVREVSDGLMYRDFITVGLLLKDCRSAKTPPEPGCYPITGSISRSRTCWSAGMQIFNNWSPYMVADPNQVWIGLEYFCYDTDDLWKKSDADMIALAKEEVERIGIIEREDVLDATVIRMPKTYPAYFGTYDRFRRDSRLRRPLRESVPGRPQRHAQVQQPGPFHADGHDGGG